MQTATKLMASAILVLLLIPAAVSLSNTPSTAECADDAGCNDNNACTIDRCSKSSSCYHESQYEGCSYKNVCLPTGIRLNKKYCDTSSIKPQKGTNVACSENYQCKTNLCVNNKCISPRLINKFLRWLKTTNH